MNIKELYKGLNEGRRYCLKSDFLHMARGYCDGTYKYFTPHVALAADSAHIYWSCYGSSAEGNNLKNLTWLLKEIFKCSANDFIEYPEF